MKTVNTEFPPCAPFVRPPPADGADVEAAEEEDAGVPEKEEVEDQAWWDMKDERGKYQVAYGKIRRYYPKYQEKYR